jgi:hypothetical protein
MAALTHAVVFGLVALGTFTSLSPLGHIKRIDGPDADVKEKHLPDMRRDSNCPDSSLYSKQENTQEVNHAITAPRSVGRYPCTRESSNY